MSRPTAKATFRGPVRIKPKTGSANDSTLLLQNQDQTATWYIGVDESDSDKLKIGRGLVVGTNVDVSIDTSGLPSFTQILIPEAGLIKQENDTGSVELTGSDAADEASNIKLYGAGHATLAGDVVIRDATTNVWAYDKSANTLVQGLSTATVHTVKGAELIAEAATAGNFLLNKSENTGSLEITADVATGTGANIFIYGAAGADAGAMHLRSAGTTRFKINATGLGFYGVTPVARASAYTQTYATADKTHSNATAAALTVVDGAGTNDGSIAAITADTSVIAAVQELADQINKLVADQLDTKQLCNAIIDDLQAYGLMQ